MFLILLAMILLGYEMLGLLGAFFVVLIMGISYLLVHISVVSRLLERIFTEE